MLPLSLYHKQPYIIAYAINEAEWMRVNLNMHDSIQWARLLCTDEVFFLPNKKD